MSLARAPTKGSHKPLIIRKKVEKEEPESPPSINVYIQAVPQPLYVASTHPENVRIYSKLFARGDERLVYSKEPGFDINRVLLPVAVVAKGAMTHVIRQLENHRALTINVPLKVDVISLAQFGYVLEVFAACELLDITPQQIHVHGHILHHVEHRELSAKDMVRTHAIFKHYPSKLYDVMTYHQAKFMLTVPEPGWAKMQELMGPNGDQNAELVADLRAQMEKVEDPAQQNVESGFTWKNWKGKGKKGRRNGGGRGGGNNGRKWRGGKPDEQGGNAAAEA